MATNSDSFQVPGKVTGFSYVHFKCIPETYTAGADVQCSFVVSEDVNVNSRDWVGLYKVGWRSSSDYYYYEWSPVPTNYITGTEVANRVLFPGNMIAAAFSLCNYFFYFVKFGNSANYLNTVMLIGPFRNLCAPRMCIAVSVWQKMIGVL